MPNPPGRSASGSLLRSHAALAITALLGLGAVLSRDARGNPFAPSLLLIVLQLPAIVLWLVQRCGIFKSSEPDGATDRSAGSALTITAVVFLVAGAAAALAGRAGILFAILTFYVAAMVAADLVTVWVARLASPEPNIRELVRAAVAGWLVIIVIGTAVLAAPLSTDSAVPDYRYNFWLHVGYCAQSAASAACLVGSSGYDIGSDFSPFGRFVIYALMQIGALGVAALAVAAIRAMTSAVIRLRTVMSAAVVIQLVAAAVIYPAWRAADTPDAAARAGWSLFHAAASLYNCGFALRADGLATYLSSSSIFVVTTALAIIGSIGLPTFAAALAAVKRSPGDAALSRSPLQRVVNHEFAVAFCLLFLCAIILFVCETPGAIPKLFISDRPVDLGPKQVPLHEMAVGPRWQAAVFLATAARSSGFAGLPLAQGAINWITLAVLCVWMMIGGAAGSFAGGMRTTTLIALATLFFASLGKTAADDESIALRKSVRRRLLQLVAIVLGLNAVAVLALVLTQEASAWERILEGVAVASGVGWTGGLAPHLTPIARCLMIVIMIAGRLLPLIWWCRIALLVNPAPPAEPAIPVASPRPDRAARRKK